MVTKPTPGATGWNVAVDEVIDIANSVADLPTRVDALEAGGGGDVTEAELAAGLATKAAAVHNHAEFITQDNGDNRYILQTVAGTFAPAEATTTALAGKQPLDADLTTLAGLDSATAGTVASDGAGWVKKTYAQMKTALGLGNVDNTSDANKPISTATQTALDAKTTAVVLTATGDGTTDATAAINAQLAAAPAGSVVRGVPGKNYLISAPLVLRSGGQQTLDMTGCTVTLAAGSLCNMLRNGAVAAQRTITATTTAASTTLTATAGVFSSADVGRTVVVTGAGPLSDANATIGATWSTNLCTDITAVAGDGSTATMERAATQAVSGASVAVHARDRDVTVTGGTWDRGANNGTNNNLHSLFFRHIDGFRLIRPRYQSTGGKYGVFLGDLRRFWVDSPDIASNSDGVHGIGPLTDGYVLNVNAERTGDDTVAFGCADYQPYADIAGPISNVHVLGVNTTSSKAAVKIFNATDGVYRTSGCSVRSIRGTTGASAVVLGSQGASGLSGAGIDDILVDDVAAYPPNASSAVSVSGASIDSVRLRRVRTLNPAATAVTVAANTAVTRMTVEQVEMAAAATQRGVTVLVGATVTSLDVSSSDVSLSGANRLVNISGQVDKLSIRGCSQAAGDYLVYTNSAAPTDILMSNCRSGTQLLNVAGAGAVTIRAIACHAEGTGLPAFRATSTGALTAYLGECTSANASTFGRLNTPTIRATGSGVRTDITILTPAAGDQVYNTNAAASTGTGLSVYTGTAWKNLQV